MKKKIILYLLIGLFLINTYFVVCDKTFFIDNFFHNILYIDNFSFLDSFMKFITFFGSSVCIVGLNILIIIFFYKNKSINVFDLTGLMIISTVLNNLIKLIIKRPRPEYITIVEKTFSYPSGHTMASVTFYLLLTYFVYKSHLQKKYKYLLISFFVFLTLLILISRIYLGAHYFTDVFGGALLSFIILISYILYREKRL